jgi:hypothetical protein
MTNDERTRSIHRFRESMDPVTGLAQPWMRTIAFRDTGFVLRRFNNTFWETPVFPIFQTVCEAELQGANEWQEVEMLPCLLQVDETWVSGHTIRRPLWTMKDKRTIAWTGDFDVMKLESWRERSSNGTLWRVQGAGQCTTIPPTKLRVVTMDHTRVLPQVCHKVEHRSCESSCGPRGPRGPRGFPGDVEPDLQANIIAETATL